MIDPLRPPPQSKQLRQAIIALSDDALKDAARAIARFVDEARAPLVVRQTVHEPGNAIIDRFGPDKSLVVVGFDLHGAVTGGFAQLLHEEGAARLASILAGRPMTADDAVGVIAELGNIAASAFLNRLAGHLGGACLPSVPRLFKGSPQATVTSIFGDDAPEIATLSLTLGEVPLLLATTPVPFAPIQRGWPRS